jgi:hypothetical protein
MTSTGPLAEGAQADSSGPDVLARIAVERPRLMATKSAIARTQRLLRHNATAQQWQRDVTKQAEVILTLPPLTPDWIHVPEETGAAPLPCVQPT